MQCDVSERASGRRTDAIRASHIQRVVTISRARGGIDDFAFPRFARVYMYIDAYVCARINCAFAKLEFRNAQRRLFYC